MIPVRALHKSYCMFYRLRHWRQRHFTSAGVIVIIALFLSFLFGFNILRTSIYQAAVLFFTILLFSILYSLFSFQIKLRIKRHLPRYTSVGSGLSYEIEIENLTNKIQKGLVLFEEILDPRPSLVSLSNTKEPFEEKRNAWDRKTLYYRWKWLLHKNAKAYLPPVLLPDLYPKDCVRIKVESTAQYRGYLHLAGFTIARPDVFGLLNRLHTMVRKDKILVLPQRVQVESPNLASNRHYHPGGVSLASSIGNSDEFMSLRPYRPGDPLRNVHWRSFAKTSELVIKEFEDEHFVRHALILDTFSLVNDQDVFETAVRLAASYVIDLQGPESILDLLFAGQQVYSFTSGRGLGQTARMLEVLACVETCGLKTIRALTGALCKNMDQICGAICIFLDWNDEHQSIYKLFEQAQVSTHIIVVTKDRKKMEKKILETAVNLEHIKVVEV
ncbi:MAG: DUF58 domain-containing protein [Desulfobacula sp.]|nr:DUF58 domain-containing protein [Desulfobacula sp.]